MDNYIVDEMIAIIEGEELEDDELMHYGVKRRSGRYPWGSGDDPYQHGGDFISRIDALKKEGWTETPENIKKVFGENMTTTRYRNEIAYANYERRLLEVARAKSLKEDGLGATEIGKIMGINESSVRSLLDGNREARMNKAKETTEFLKKRMEETGKFLDVGTGVERELKISPEKLNLALFMLEKEGYCVYKGGIPQVTNKGKQTNQKVLCPPGTEHKEIYDFDKIGTVKDYTSHDGGETFTKFVYPKSMDSKRMMVRYAEDGGIEKDGIVELRRGVDDLSLGTSRYSQVRILVDKTHYIKGMAVYGDNMPDGVDVIFNTNKKAGTPLNKVLKEIKADPDNPFGSLIKPDGQSYYTDKNGKKQLSLINKRADEGDWDDWADALPSQFLGKQSISMAKKQLNLAKADKADEFDTLCSLTQPTIKKHLLEKFADECDSAAVHLKAAALPGQKYHVIIPVNTLKDNEVYAPNYADGTKVALVRYPHGGTFEIPILTVNNKHAAARKLIGTDVIDAVGINKNNADRLSGADFDGDTVMVIPTHDRGGKVRITSTKPLKDLEGFDPKDAYPEVPGMKYMKNTQNEMGKISNLITDMTLAGANNAELARAVKHSMVVIDAEKHKLDYKRSEVENDIASLRQKYQRRIDEDGNLHIGGASTILSRAKGQESVDKRQGTPKTNIKGTEWYDPTKPEGAKIYKSADDLYYPERSYNKEAGTITIRKADGKKLTYNIKDPGEADYYNPVKKVDPNTGEVTFTNKDGSIVYRSNKRTEKSTKMAETDDAYTLVSEAKHPMEMVYADYANSMKAMGNKARLEVAATPKAEYSKTAKDAYKPEVDSLMTKLNNALLNASRERAAQRAANLEVDAKKALDPGMKPGDIKKAGQMAITAKRNEVGSVSRRDREIHITDKEWEAIQAGAISENKLKKILDNTDVDKLRERAMPRQQTSLSTAKVNRIKAMSASNHTLKEIAEQLNLPTSTVSNVLKGAN